MPAHPSESPAKKQSKWSPEEDALIIDLRGSGMKWEDISKRLPGRSAISCRLHYQNYLERRSEWDEERKNKLARLYERFKPEMWSKVAEEMAVPWRAAEAMHWQLGEADMARRAGVVPFSLSSTTLEPHGPPGPHRHSPSRSQGSVGHAHSLSQGSIGQGHGVTPANMPPTTRFQRSVHNAPPPTRSLAAATRRDSIPRSVQNQNDLVLAGIGSGPMGRGSSGVAGVSVSGGGQMLPSVAEMTTGMSPYNTPAYSVAGGGGGGYTSPGPLLPSLGGGVGYGIGRGMDRMEKRRASPDAAGARESSKRRQ